MEMFAVGRRLLQLFPFVFYILLASTSNTNCYEVFHLRFLYIFGWMWVWIDETIEVLPDLYTFF